MQLPLNQMKMMFGLPGMFRIIKTKFQFKLVINDIRGYFFSIN